jgi:hypothetical protein
MQFKTFGTLKSKVQSETDTSAEDFVTETEIMEYFQEAVDECAAHMYKIWPLATQYFETLSKEDLAVDQQLVTLPTNIYARAITRIQLVNNSRVLEITRFKNSKRYDDVAQLSTHGNQGDPEKYLFINDSVSNTHQIQLWPSSKEAGTDILWIWYVREPIQIEDDDSLVDIPEFYYYITSYVKWKIYDKEGSPQAAEAKADRDEKRALMLETLAEMTPDEDNKLEGDYSTYEEMS